MAGLTKREKSPKAKRQEEYREERIESLETEIFGAIKSLMIEKVMFDSGQREEDIFLFKSVSLIREIDKSAKISAKLNTLLPKKLFQKWLRQSQLNLA